MSGGPVWLEKLIDSHTWRLFESPGFVFRPVLASLGQEAASFRAKLVVFCQKWTCSEQNSSFSEQKMGVVRAKMDRSTYTRPSWDAQGTPTQVGRDTPTEARNESAVGIRPLDGTSGCQ